VLLCCEFPKYRDILVKIISLYSFFVDTPNESDLVTTFLCSAWFEKSKQWIYQMMTNLDGHFQIPWVWQTDRIVRAHNLLACIQNVRVRTRKDVNWIWYLAGSQSYCTCVCVVKSLGAAVFSVPWACRSVYPVLRQGMQDVVSCHLCFPVRSWPQNYVWWRRRRRTTKGVFLSVLTLLLHYLCQFWNKCGFWVNSVCFHDRFLPTLIPGKNVWGVA